MKDLVCLVADKNMEAAVRRLLARPQSLGIRPLSADVPVHPRRDPGCYHEGWTFLAERRTDYEHGLLMLDRAWEGAPAATGLELEEKLREKRAIHGIEGWAAVVVIDPELEVWVFSDSPHVATALGWDGRRPPLREWLTARKLWAAESAKPADPKVAVEAALREVRLPRSSSIYGALATMVSLERCVDPSFSRLCRTLRAWFPAQVAADH